MTNEMSNQHLSENIVETDMTDESVHSDSSSSIDPLESDDDRDWKEGSTTKVNELRAESSFSHDVSYNNSNSNNQPSLDHVTFSPHLVDEYYGTGHRRILEIEEEPEGEEGEEEEEEEEEGEERDITDIIQEERVIEEEHGGVDNVPSNGVEQEGTRQTEGNLVERPILQRLQHPQSPSPSPSPYTSPSPQPLHIIARQNLAARHYGHFDDPSESIRTAAYTAGHGNTISLVNETDPLLARRHVIYLRSQPKARIFFSKPFFPPLIFDNHVSEARDLCAAERNFLAGLKMGIALGVAGAVLYMDLKLPSNDDNRPVDPDPEVLSNKAISPTWATALAIIFFTLSMLTIVASFINYIHTVASLAMQEAKVTTHKVFGYLLFGTAAIILASNVVVIVKNGE